MPEPKTDVKDTDVVTVPDSSLEETTDNTQTEVIPKTDETGVVVEGVEEPIKPAEIPVVDEYGVSYYNRNKELERRLEKANAQIEAIQDKKGITDTEKKEAVEQGYAQLADDLGVDIETAKKLDTYFTRKAASIVDNATSSTRQVTIHSLYERGCNALRTDITNYPDYEEIKPEMDKMIDELLKAKVYQNPSIWSDPKLIREIAIRARGTMALSWRKEALKKGIKLGNQNKQIIGEAGVKTEQAARTTAGGITSEAKVFAQRTGMPEQAAQDILNKRDKRAKEAVEFQKNR